MKTRIQFKSAPLWLLAVNLGAAILFGGCATHDEHSFNQDFNQDLSTRPKYYIADEDSDHFRIYVHQGVASTTADRVLDVKTAAKAVAQSECTRLGWQKWHLDYIQERDQGWMHVVIANVKHESDAAGPQ